MSDHDADRCEYRTVDGMRLADLVDEFAAALEAHDARPNLRTALCEPTTEKTVGILEAADDCPGRWLASTNRRLLTLPEPDRFAWWALEVVPEELEGRMDEGGCVHRCLTADQLRARFAVGLETDGRCISSLIFRACLDPEAWYNGGICPPQFGSERFDRTHNHYLATRRSADHPLLLLYAQVAAHYHIFHHGYTGDLVSFVNPEQPIEARDLAAVGPMGSRTDSLAAMGIDPAGAFCVAGVPVCPTDWIPSGYMLTLSLDEKALVWREPEGSDVAGRLQVYFQDVDSCPLSMPLQRCGSVVAVRPGAGVVTQLDADKWVPPPLWVAGLMPHQCEHGPPELGREAPLPPRGAGRIPVAAAEQEALSCSDS